MGKVYLEIAAHGDVIENVKLHEERKSKNDVEVPFDDGVMDIYIFKTINGKSLKRPLKLGVGKIPPFMKPEQYIFAAIDNLESA